MPSVPPVLGMLPARTARTADGCLEWQRGRDRDGYGIISVDNRQKRVTRLVYEATHGPIPDGLLVCHRCDNPPCCEPSHLFLGTIRENALDAKAKGRLATGVRNGAYTKPHRRRRGEEHGGAVLTDSDVVEIRTLYAAGGVTMAQLGDKYGVTKGHVHRIVHRVSRVTS